MRQLQSTGTFGRVPFAHKSSTRFHPEGRPKKAEVLLKVLVGGADRIRGPTSSLLECRTLRQPFFTSYFSRVFFFWFWDLEDTSSMPCVPAPVTSSDTSQLPCRTPLQFISLMSNGRRTRYLGVMGNYQKTTGWLLPGEDNLKDPP